MPERSVEQFDLFANPPKPSEPLGGSEDKPEKPKAAAGKPIKKIFPPEVLEKIFGNEGDSGDAEMEPGKSRKKRVFRKSQPHRVDPLPGVRLGDRDKKYHW